MAGKIVQQIQSISGKVPLEVKQPLEAIRVILNSITQGKHPDIVTTSTLRQLGLATVTPGGGLAPNDTQLMPAIQNLAVTGAFSSILLSWDGINSTAFSHTEIHRAMVDDIGQAVLVGTTSASLFSDSPPNNATTVTYYYWVRAVNKANVAGAFNSTAGTAGSTATDPAYALELLAGKLSESSLAPSLSSRINLIDISAEAILQNVLAGNSDLASKYESLALIQTEATTRADADGALSSLITTLQALAGDNTAAIQIESSVRASSFAPDWVANTAYIVDNIVVDNGKVYRCITANQDAVFTVANWELYSLTNAQYTVKTDVNGKVAGFGLANNGVISEFIINSDIFGFSIGTVQAWSATKEYILGEMIVGSAQLNQDVVWECTKYGISGVSEPSFGSNPTLGATVVSDGISPDDVGWTAVKPTLYPFIIDAQTGITHLKAASIQKATITSAHIKDLSADKISAGTITAFIELIAPIIRSNGATALNVGSGIYIDANAKTMRIGDPQGNHLLWDGVNLTVNGGGVFSGDISAATGVFSGDISAATGNIGGQAGSIANQGSLAVLNVVGGAQIDNLAVSTLKIADNAVTVPVGVTGTFAAINASGGKVIAAFTITLQGRNNQYSTAGTYGYTIKRDAVIIYETGNVLKGLTTSSITINDSPGLGSHVYSIIPHKGTGPSGATNTPTVTKSYVSLLGAKK